MSRRDTIIVAVLVNAALLMILFATAVRTDHSSIETKTTQLVKAEPVQEDVLNQYITSIPTLAEKEEAENSEPIELVLSEPEPIPEVVVKEPAKPAREFANVTVKKGDFLEKIAKSNQTSVSAIMEANQLNSTQLKIGQVLKVPLGKGEKAVPTPKPASKEEYYVVKEGDNPWLIASRNHIKLDELLKLNGLDEQKAKRLRPGDKLRIR